MFRYPFKRVAPGSTAARAIRQITFSPVVDSLEKKDLLAGAALSPAALVTQGGTISRPAEVDTLTLKLGRDRLAPGGSGQSVVDLQLAPIGDSKFRAGQFQLIGPNGRPVTALSYRTTATSLTGRLQLGPGDYTIKVRGRGASLGAYTVQVSLVGDVDSNRKVDQTDLNLIQAAVGRRAPSSPLDVNRDRAINNQDVLAARRNLGAAVQTIQFQIVNSTGKFTNDQVYMGIYGQVTRLQSSNNPSGWAYIDPTGTARSLYTSDGALLYVPTFTLEQAPNGVEIPRNEVIISGQVYLGLGSPPVLRVNTGVNPTGGITVSSGGSGYVNPTVSFSGSATGEATVSNGKVSALKVNFGGKGYTSAPRVVLVGGGGIGATATATIKDGAVSGLTIVNAGSGYTTAPTVTIAGGTGALATAVVQNGVIQQINVNGSGVGYSTAPTVIITDASGTGATATATLLLSGVAAPAPSNGSDPNNSVYWNFAEFTLNSPAGSLNTDLSQVDQVGFPLRLQVVPNDPANSVGVGVYPAITGLFEDYRKYMATPNRSAFVALLDSSGTGANGPFRIVSPGDYAALKPTDPLALYFNDEIDKVFAPGNTMTLLSAALAPLQQATATAQIDAATLQVQSVTVTNPGSGFFNIPTVTLSGGGGSGATAVVAGSVTALNLASFGSGYTTAPTVTISGGGGSGATANAVVTNGIVTMLNLTNFGSGYTSAPTVTISGGGGSGASASSKLGLLGGAVNTVVVTSPGSGYTSAPSVVFSLPSVPSPTSAAQAVATLKDGGITSVSVTGGGSGYVFAPGLALSGGGAGATANAAVSGGGVSAVTITNGGLGYGSAPSVTITGGGGSGATATAVVSGGVVTGVTITSAGTNYTSPPSVIISGGSGFQAVVETSGPVSALNLTSGGSGYTSAPTVTISGGGGTGATATATITNGKVTGLTVVNPGSGYTSAPTVVISGGGGTGAMATAFRDGAVTSIKVLNPGHGYTSVPAVVFTQPPAFVYQGEVIQIPNGVNPSAPYNVLRLTGQNGSQLGNVYDIYSPKTLPPWLPSVPNNTPSWMVLANAGVFADNIQQYPTDLNSSMILGNIENQIVSAMSRGVARLSYAAWNDATQFYPLGSTANWYAAFLHRSSITINGFAYGFAFDDQGGNSTDLSTINPTRLIINLGWNTALYP